jgi:hypothetical protein
MSAAQPAAVNGERVSVHVFDADEPGNTREMIPRDGAVWLTMRKMSIIAVPTRFRRAIDIGFVVMVVIGLIVAIVHDFSG